MSDQIDPFADVPAPRSGVVVPLRGEITGVRASPYHWRDSTAIPRRPWIYGREKMRGQVGGKLAPGAAAKTTHEIATALAMASGRALLGKQVWGGPKRVWLWNLEDSSDELARTIQATCKFYGISESDLGGRLFVDSALDGAVLKLARQNSADGVVVNKQLTADLIDELRAREIDYLSIDPFISSHSVEENDNGAIDAVVKEYAFVAKAANCAIGLAHHVNKAGTAEVTSLSARGASSMVAALRSALVINRMSADEADGWGIGVEERRRYFRIYDDKNNRAPPADKSDWFKLESVDLGNGDDDGMTPGDSIGVVTQWTPPDAFEGVTVNDLLTVQRAVEEQTGISPVRASSQATRWVGNLVAKALDLDVNKKDERSRINKMLKQWIMNGALKQVEIADKNGDIRPCVTVGEWAIPTGETGAPAPRKTEVRASAEGAGRPTSPVPAPPPL